MRRSRIAAIAAALVGISSVALALGVASPHWMGMLEGTAGMKTTGSAMMMATTDGKATEVTIELKGETPSATRPWHVHSGSCAKGGPPLGGMKPYSPISMDAKGNGVSKATLPITVPDTGSYNVNIHESSTNMSKIVACGDLKKM
jgi:superoxide dismutase, Cu-Zn family